MRDEYDDGPSMCPAKIEFMGATMRCINNKGHYTKHVTDYFQVVNGKITEWANQRETQATAKVWWEDNDAR